MRKTALLFFIIFNSILWADDVTVSLDKYLLTIDDSIIYGIKITSEREMQPYDFMEIPGADVEYLGVKSGYQQTILNNQVTAFYTYENYFKITPKKTGTFIIPEQRIIVGTETYIISEQKITVLNKVERDKSRLVINFEKEKIYTSEKCIVDFIWYVNPNTAEISFSSEKINNNISIDEAIDRIMVNDEKPLTVLYNNEEVTGYYSVSEGYIRISRNWIFDKPVHVKADKLVLNFAVLNKDRTAIIHNDQNIGEGLSLNVLQLPFKGRPADFSGIIGFLDVFVTAAPETVTVGEPITLQITIEGDIDENFKLPDLQNQKGFKDNFTFPFTSSPGKYQQKKIAFVQSIRPQNSDITEIPPIAVSYFDSASGTYKYAYSNPVNVKIHSVSITDADDLKSNVKDREESTDHEINEKGIRHNYSAVQLVTCKEESSNKVNYRLLYTIGTVLIILIFIVFLLFSLRKRKKAGANRKLSQKIDSLHTGQLYLFSVISNTLGIKEHANIPRLRDQIAESDKNEKWKQSANKALTELFNYKLSEEQTLKQLKKAIEIMKLNEHLTTVKRNEK